MKPGIEDQLRKMVESSTKRAAIAEWKEASEKQRRPLYNYRLDHVEEVVELAKYIGESTDADLEVVTLAAWFHDLAKPGVGGINAKDHGRVSGELAEDWLTKAGYDSEITSRVSDVIRKHVGLTLEKPLEPIEAQVLWEADKILKLGFIGLIQYILNNIRISAGLSLIEISEKLHEFLPLATKIARSVNTERGREIADDRLQRLFVLSEMLDSELNPGSD